MIKGHKQGFSAILRAMKKGDVIYTEKSFSKVCGHFKPAYDLATQGFKTKQFLLIDEHATTLK